VSILKMMMYFLLLAGLLEVATAVKVVVKMAGLAWSL
jgi:hypothetical protein